MGFPTVTVQVAFDSDPGDVPVWTDVTAYLRQPITIRRGRQTVLDRFEAGDMSLTLANSDRRFEPEFAAGPYYPNVLPMRRVQVIALWDAVTYEVFSGFALGWPPEYPGQKDAVVRVKAVDGFHVLALKKLTGSYAEELSSVRVTNILDDAGWPAADRAISTGQSTMQASTLTRARALQHLQDVAWSENGRLFVDAAGLLTFQDRHAPIKSPYDTSQGTFGDDPGELPYSDIALSFDDSEIWNDVVVARTGGTAQTASDATSGTRYLERTLAKSDLLINSDNEALAAAEYLLSRYKDPYLRIPEIELKGHSDDTLWPHVLGREIGDRITVNRRPDAGAAISQESIIERIEHDISQTAWITRWRLSPADTQAYWILDSLTNSVLNSTTRLAY